MKTTAFSLFVPRPRRLSLAVVLAVALVILQTLGLLHRIAHADRGLSASAAVVPTPFAVSALAAPPTGVARGDSPASGADWLQALFSSHHQLHDCAMYDQLSHADLAFGVALDALVEPAPIGAPFVHSAWHAAAQAQGFLARGPPTI